MTKPKDVVEATMAVTKRDLYDFLSVAGCYDKKLPTHKEAQEEFDLSLSQQKWDYLVRAHENKDVMSVTADESMSENHIGGDDVIAIVNDTINLASKGYKIVTWYGENTEVLIAGVRDIRMEK